MSPTPRSAPKPSCRFRLLSVPSDRDRLVELEAAACRLCHGSSGHEASMRSHHQRHPTSLPLDDDHQWPGHVSDLEVDVHRASLAVLVFSIIFCPACSIWAPDAVPNVASASCLQSGSQAHTRAGKLKPQLHCPPSRLQSTPHATRDRQQFR